MRSLLRQVQHQLFNLGGELSLPGQALLHTDEVAALDQALAARPDLKRRTIVDVDPVSVL